MRRSCELDAGLVGAALAVPVAVLASDDEVAGRLDDVLRKLRNVCVLAANARERLVERADVERLLHGERQHRRVRVVVRSAVLAEVLVIELRGSATFRTADFERGEVLRLEPCEMARRVDERLVLLAGVAAEDLLLLVVELVRSDGGGKAVVENPPRLADRRERDAALLDVLDRRVNAVAFFRALDLAANGLDCGAIVARDNRHRDETEIPTERLRVVALDGVERALEHRLLRDGRADVVDVGLDDVLLRVHDVTRFQ